MTPRAWNVVYLYTSGPIGRIEWLRFLLAATYLALANTAANLGRTKRHESISRQSNPLNISIGLDFPSGIEVPVDIAALPYDRVRALDGIQHLAARA